MALMSAMGNITLLQDDTPNCTQTQQDIHRLLLYFELLKGYTKLAVTALATASTREKMNMNCNNYYCYCDPIQRIQNPRHVTLLNP
ncbi:hypothetical protein P5V15_002531 [Pogonomyrmex californicus]